MKTNEKKKLLIGVVVIALFGTLALLHQKGLFPFKKFIAGIEREEGNEIRVTSTDQEVPFQDNGNCTLGEALKAAGDNAAIDACPAGVADRSDIIILQENATYTLQRAAFSNRDNRDALRAVPNRGILIIEGNSATLERPQDAPEEFRLLRSEGRVTLRDITFKGGKSDTMGSVNGGAVHHRLGNLTVLNCRFHQNTGLHGGAIYMEHLDSTGRRYSELVVENGIFTGNSAGAGGALYVSGNVTIRASTLSNNVSRGSGGAIVKGAALVLRDPQNNVLPDKTRMTIMDSTLRENGSSGRGGGIYISGRTEERGQAVRWEPLVTVTRTTFARNSARHGGALANQGNTLINDSAFIENRADTSAGGILSDGGVFGIEPGPPGNMLQLWNSTVGRNSAGEKGGGIRTADQSPLMLYNTTITENSTANDDTDGIAVGSTVIMQNSILAGNNLRDCWKAGEGLLLRSMGHNLFGNMGNCSLVPNGGADGDMTGVDPELGELRGQENNRAGNEHFPLGTNSPAINAGVNPQDETLERDQLGNERVEEYDIGSVEALCGDGISHPLLNEQCDDKNDVNTDDCLNDCTQARCGDGIVQAGVELCDDANQADGDGCPSNCREPACGDAIVQAERGEACDDGNKNNEDACLSSCVIASCGDGLVQRGAEECDDGNRINDDACGNNCVEAKCGDSLKQDNEECDDGNQIANDQCTNDCKIFVAVAPPPPAPVDEEGAAMAADGGLADMAQADPGSDEEAGVPDFGPTDIDGQTVPPPTGNTTGGKPSPTSSDSPDEEEEGNGGGSGGGCSLMIEK